MHNPTETSALSELISTIKTLRGPNGCPWDLKQTFESLSPYILEEAYELHEALQDKNFDAIKEELGDVLLQVVMLSNMAEESHKFNFNAVAKALNEKMIRRHPHVFGNTQVNSEEDVLKNWETIKKEEKQSQSIMDLVPNLPALMKAEKIQKKAAKLGFDWPTTEGAMNKLQEECNELVLAIQKADKPNIEEEAGDILFSIVNCLRKIGINPENALKKTNKKFINRFKYMENNSEDFEGLSLEEKENLWQQSKKTQ